MSDHATMIPIDATLGNENTRIGGVSAYMFWVSRPEDNAVKAELGMDTACRVSVKLRKEWGSEEMAQLGKTRDEGGAWTKNRYTVADGVSLKVWVEKSLHGKPAGKANVILLCRKDAPVNVITVQLSGLPTCTRKNITITGQFWVLNRDTVKDFPEVPKLTSQAEYFASPLAIAEVFDVLEMIPAKEKPMAQKVVHSVFNDPAPTKAAGTIIEGSISLTTKKGRRQLG